MGLREKVVNGVIWSFAERFSAQIVSFIVSIVLARLIAPEDFGAIAMVLVFTNILDTFATAGFGSALIQKKDADELDFSSVFFFNIAFSLSLYALLFISAPFIANFYNMPIIEPVIRVIGIRIVLASINSIQRAFVSRQMQFKKFFYATFVGTVVSAVVGIVMALLKYGIWALVAQYLVGSLLGVITLRFVIDWRPKLIFSFKRLKSLFSFGWKILGSSLLSSIYIELTDLIIGKFYTPASLAFYNRGKKIPQLFVSQINSSIDTVLFPAMSKHQSDKSKLKLDISYSIQMGSFLIFPLIFGIAMVAEDLVVVLLSDTWLECVPYLRIACLSYALLPLSMANIQAIKAIGRSDVYLKLDIVKKVIGVTLLLCFFKYGVILIATADALSNILGLFVNVIPNRKLIGYSLSNLIKDVIPSIILTIVMCLIMYVVSLTGWHGLFYLIIQFIIAVIIYVGLAYLSKNQMLSEIIQILHKFRNNGKK